MKKAFTLAEMLAVVAVVAIIAAITFPVLAAAKRRAGEADDIAKMRQLYLCFTMYEEDHSELAPSNLATLRPYATDVRLFRSVNDRTRKPTGRGLWNGRMFVPCTNDYSQFQISYAYLKTFPPHDESDSTWRETRANPQFGLLASPWSASILETPRLKLRCGDAVLDAVGPRFDGPILRVQMDGSLFRLSSNREKGIMGSYKDFFVNR